MAIVDSTTCEAPGRSGIPVDLQERNENFIGGEWIAPSTGDYRKNLTPSTGEPFCEVAHSGPQDIELALDAAHAAKDQWGQRSPAERDAVLNDVADAMQENLEMLAVAESYENGKPCVPRRDGCQRSMTRPTPTTSRSRSASWARSSRSTFRC